MKPGNLLHSKVPNPAKESKDEGEKRISFCPSGRALFYARKGIRYEQQKNLYFRVRYTGTSR